jgi:hypothetical protein
VGFPIRKFSDQSLFAAPQDLSQRTTSFIASQRQGIHQIPLRHLIVLIIKERGGSEQYSVNSEQKKDIPHSRTQSRPMSSNLFDRKDQFCFKHIREPCGQARPTTEMLLPDGGKQTTETGRGSRPDHARRSTRTPPHGERLELFHHPVSTECVSSSR